jgi:hypothetical protein
MSRRYREVRVPGASTYEATLAIEQIAAVKRAIYAATVRAGSSEKACVTMGLNDQHLTQVRQGSRRISADLVDRLARMLGVDRTEVLAWQGI